MNRLFFSSLCFVAVCSTACKERPIDSATSSSVELSPKVGLEVNVDSTVIQTADDDFKWIVEQTNCERKVDSNLRDYYEMDFVNNTEAIVVGISMQNAQIFSSGIDRVSKRIKLRLLPHKKRHYKSNDFDCSWSVYEVYTSNGKVYPGFSDIKPD